MHAHRIYTLNRKKTPFFFNQKHSSSFDFSHIPINITGTEEKVLHIYFMKEETNSLQAFD
jgi:hypothetical protein